MKVAIVHDDLVQWGGAERVLLGLCEIYPEAEIYTSVIDFKNNFIKNNFSNKKINTSFLQKIPFWKKIYKVLLPLYPIAFEQFNFDKYDLVISQTTRFAKSVITKPYTLHICYCHTPPRFLWHLSGLKNYGIFEFLMSKLRLYDQISSKRVDKYIAGSENAKQRIEKIYREKSKVIYPFVDLNRFKNVETFNGGYFVVVGRPNKYKRFDLAKEVCRKLNIELKIIEGNLSEEKVIRILAGCKALIISGEEDFGLSALEAQSLGKPVIAYKSGGVLETVIENETGIFFEEQNAKSLEEAINRLNKLNIDSQKCVDNVIRFSKQNFIRHFKQTVASLLYT